MTFEEFKKLALHPPYIDQESVYRVDVHCRTHLGESEAHETQFEVRRTHSFIYPDRNSAEIKLKQIIADNKLLYAIYLYQLPLGKDISNDLYQRLWVYDRFGKLNGQSRCTAMIEDLDHPSAKFRGHDSESTCFKPSDIVEVYDRENEIVRLATIIEMPMTIEQCWEERRIVESCIILDGLDTKNTDDNYWLYADSDSYTAVNGPDIDKNRLFPRSYDILEVNYPISPEIRLRFNEYYRHASNAINNEKAARQKAIDKMMNDFINLL